MTIYLLKSPKKIIKITLLWFLVFSGHGTILRSSPHKMDKVNKDKVGNVDIMDKVDKDNSIKGGQDGRE